MDAHYCFRNCWLSLQHANLSPYWGLSIFLFQTFYFLILINIQWRGLHGLKRFRLNKKAHPLFLPQVFAETRDRNLPAYNYSIDYYSKRCSNNVAAVIGIPGIYYYRFTFFIFCNIPYPGPFVCFCCIINHISKFRLYW